MPQFPQQYSRWIGATPVEWSVYPAADDRAVASLRSAKAAIAVSAEGAVCYSHPGNAATASCQICGSYLCSLCALPIGERILCPTCVSRGEHNKHIGDEMVKSRVCWDRALLLCSFIQLIFSFIALITGWVLLFIIFKKWKAPGSLVSGRSSLRLIVALLMTLAAMAFSWFSLGKYLFFRS